MKKFIILYRASSEDLREMNVSSEAGIQKNMDSWVAWANKCGDKLIDMGTPLKGGMEVNGDGTSQSNTTGICGYSVMAAEDMTEAMELLEDHPHFGGSSGCTIDIHETLPLPMVQD